MRIRAFVLPSSLLAAAVIVALWALLSDGSSSRAPASSSTGGGAGFAESRPLPPVSGAGWQPGTVYEHDVQMRVALTGAGAPNTSVEVKGRWRTLVVRASASEQDLQVTFEPDPGSLAGSQGAALQELAQTFVARFDRQGAARALVFSRPVSVDATRLLRELITTFQVSLPPGNQTRWTATEIDPGGEVAVDYQRLDAGTFLRAKNHYLRVAGVNGLMAPGPKDVVPRLVKSEGRYRLDQAGRIHEASMRTVSRTRGLMEMDLRMDVETSFRFVSRGTSKVDRSVSVEPEPVALTLDKVDFALARKEALRSAVKGKTARGLLDEMKKGRAATDGEAAATARFRLTALMQLDDKAVATVSSEIRAGQADRGVFSALGAAGTPAAQAALMTAVTEMNLASEDRLEAVHSIHAIKEPVAQTIAAVETLAASDQDPQVRKDASYALGTLVRGLAKTDAASARAKVLQLAAEWSPSAPAVERRRVLRALGNTASVDALPVLKQGLSDSDASVREAAARSLKNIPGDEVERLLAGVIASTDQISVRLGALAACNGRKYALLAGALEKVMRGDPDGMMRAKAMQVVSLFFHEAPDSAQIAQLMEWVAQNDPEEQISKGAGQVLVEARETLASRQVN